MSIRKQPFSHGVLRYTLKGLLTGTLKGRSKGSEWSSCLPQFRPRSTASPFRRDLDDHHFGKSTSRRSLLEDHSGKINSRRPLREDQFERTTSERSFLEDHSWKTVRVREGLSMKTIHLESSWKFARIHKLRNDEPQRERATRPLDHSATLLFDHCWATPPFGYFVTTLLLDYSATLLLHYSTMALRSGLRDAPESASSWPAWKRKSNRKLQIGWKPSPGLVRQAKTGIGLAWSFKTLQTINVER